MAQGGCRAVRDVNHSPSPAGQPAGVQADTPPRLEQPEWTGGADRLADRSRAGNHDLVRDALRICLQPEHLRRTLTIAVVVGTVLTAINHADVIARGDATGATLAKAALNYLVPFIVFNLGLLVGARGERREKYSRCRWQ